MKRRYRDQDQDHHSEHHHDVGSNNDDDVPLHRLPAFGAGLKRKRVEFVRAKDQDDGVARLVATIEGEKAASIGDVYAGIVLNGSRSTGTGQETGVSATSHEAVTTDAQETVVCEVCCLPITTSLEAHNAMLSHQVSLAHSHPPSHLDRTRMGLRTLSAKGWDPDARVGLGREGAGMRFPIKVAPKDDLLGIGATIPSGTGQVAKQHQQQQQQQQQQSEKVLTAKEMKEKQRQDKMRGDRLQREMFGNLDVDRYLQKGKEWE